MECLVQYLDDLEDLIFAVALKAERIRQVVLFFLFMITAAALQVLGVFVALENPPLAMAAVAPLLVGMLYRAAIGISNESLATT